MDGLPAGRSLQIPPHPDEVRPTGVLLVEDDEDTALVIQMALELNGFTVKMATTATEALTEMIGFDPIVVILDLGLGDGQAFDLIGQMNGFSNHSIPIVALSGLRRSNMFERCLALGVSDLVTKPFSPSELIGRVSACVRA